MLAVTIASPIAWEHHYGIMFPIFALMLPACVRVQPWGAWTIPLFGVGYILVSEDFTNVTARLADSHLNVLQSSLFFGALIILALLYSLVSAPYRCAQFQDTPIASRRCGGKGVDCSSSPRLMCRGVIKI